MISYEKARNIALSHVSDAGWFNLCTECENSFIFSKYDDVSFGGISPCVVMKDTGECLNFAAALDVIGDERRYFLMDADGSLTEVSEERLNEISG